MFTVCGDLVAARGGPKRGGTIGPSFSMTTSITSATETENRAHHNKSKFRHGVSLGNSFNIMSCTRWRLKSCDVVSK